MNPNPEQPDAPYRTTVASYAIVNDRGETVATVPVEINANLICSALNASEALAPAGYDAQLVFERLREMIRVLAGYIDEHGTQEAAVFLAQLKLKRDTSGGSR